MENVKTPEDHIGTVLERVKKAYIEKTYKMTDWKDAEDFLEKIAFRGGRLLKVTATCGFYFHNRGWRVHLALCNCVVDDICTLLLNSRQAWKALQGRK